MVRVLTTALLIALALMAGEAQAQAQITSGVSGQVPVTTGSAANYNTYGIPTTGMGSPIACPGLPMRLQHWRQAECKTLAGSSFTDILCVGDSTTYSANGTGINNTPPQNPRYSNSYPYWLQQNLNARGIPSVEGMVWAYTDSNTGSNQDTRWTKNTGWTDHGQRGPAATCSIQGAVSAAGDLTFAPGYAFDSIKVCYTTNAGVFGSFNVNVDGGSSLGTMNGNTGSGHDVFSSTLTVPRGIHTVHFTNVTGNIVEVVGVMCWDSTLPAVRVTNAGVIASTTTNWNNSGVVQDIFNNLTPALTIIQLGTNDATPGASMNLATVEANLTAIIGWAQAVSSDVVTLSTFPASESTYSGVTKNMLNIADWENRIAASTFNLTPIDMMQRFVDYPSASSAGFTNDSNHEHPWTTGVMDEAQAIAQVIAPSTLPGVRSNYNGGVTALSGSTSGNMYWSMPEQGSGYKKFVFVTAASTDVGETITFPTPFLHTPAVTGNTTGLTISTISTTQIVIPAQTASTGVLTVEGI